MLEKSVREPRPGHEHSSIGKHRLPSLPLLKSSSAHGNVPAKTSSRGAFDGKVSGRGGYRGLKKNQRCLQRAATASSAGPSTKKGEVTDSPGIVQKKNTEQASPGGESRNGRLEKKRGQPATVRLREVEMGNPQDPRL